MIPCFPTSSDTDAHHFDTVSNRSLPPHLTKDIPSTNISQVRTRSTTKKLNQHTAWILYLRNGDEEECSSCCSSSRDIYNE